MRPFITAGAGFLLAVLWFDLMFDVQVLRHRGRDVAEDALASIAGYYRRVTTDAYPMNRFVAAVMLGTLAAIVAQIVRGEDPEWVAWVSAGLAAGPIALARVSTVPSAVRLGTRVDPHERQCALARSVLRDHLLCAVSIAALLVLQLASG